MTRHCRLQWSMLASLCRRVAVDHWSVPPDAPSCCRGDASLWFSGVVCVHAAVRGAHRPQGPHAVSVVRLLLGRYVEVADGGGGGLALAGYPPPRRRRRCRRPFAVLAVVVVNTLCCTESAPGELSQDDFGYLLQTLVDALEAVGVIPFVAQDDIDDMVVDAFSRPNGVIAYVHGARVAAVVQRGSSSLAVVWNFTEWRCGLLAATPSTSCGSSSGCKRARTAPCSLMSIGTCSSACGSAWCCPLVL